MASTIKLKTGTSGAPSSLTTGEVAINTTTGLWYYGNAGGATTQLHRFTNISASGHITASGNISASGNIYADEIYIADKVRMGSGTGGSENIDIVDPDGNASWIKNKTVGDNNVGLRLLNQDGDWVTYVDTDGNYNISEQGITPTYLSIGSGSSHITASGNISSSGDIYGNRLYQAGANISNIYSAIAGNSEITTVGTIEEGTWTGTAIASAHLDADTAHLSGTQTFTGTKTLNSFKGTGGATVTNILDEDAMGSNSATALATQQSIKAYADTKSILSAQKQLTHHNYKADQGTTKTYIGLGDADSEETTTSQKLELPIIAPVNGKLLKIFLRSNKNIHTHTLTWRLETIAAANFSATPGIIGTQTGAGCQNSAMTTYDFTGVTSNAVSAGNAVYISLESDTDFGNNVMYFITCLWEWDLS